MTGSVENIYSNALFEISEENKTSDELLKELDSLSEIFKENPQLIKLLSAPTVSNEEKINVAKNIFDGKISEVAMNFICVLIEKNRVSYLSKISKAYKALYNSKNNIEEITVTTSVPLSPQLKTKLKEKLETVYKKHVILKEKVDETIIGGVILNYGNTMIDSSVKTKLENMQKQIRDLIA